MTRPFDVLVLAIAVAAPALADGPPPSASGPGPGPRPRYGALMSEVGRRFELLGKAAKARRYELAAFELDELQEIFEEDLPRAELPKEPTKADLPALAEAFRKTHPPELDAALKSRDAARFAQAFARAAATCNGCHVASGHGFVEVPTSPGAPVPKLDPLPPSKGR